MHAVFKQNDLEEGAARKVLETQTQKRTSVNLKTEKIRILTDQEYLEYD